MTNKNTQQLQEIFDRVAIHLLVQNQQSINTTTDNCMYRDHDGNACAVGCLIKDSVYYEDIEHNGVTHERVVKAVNQSLGFNLTHRQLELLGRLQYMHDSNTVSDWVDDLVHIARVFDLNKSAVEFTLAYTNKVTK